VCHMINRVFVFIDERYALVDLKHGNEKKVMPCKQHQKIMLK